VASTTNQSRVMSCGLAEKVFIGELEFRSNQQSLKS
jgi:hypothetical protein